MLIEDDLLILKYRDRWVEQFNFDIEDAEYRLIIC